MNDRGRKRDLLVLRCYIVIVVVFFSPSLPRALVCIPSRVYAWVGLCVCIA